MSTIKVTPEQLHHVSSQVDQARQQLEHIQDHLSRQIMFLQAMWMGVTQERFYDDFARSRPVLQKALESMVYTSKELKDIAIRFENADAEKGSLGGVIGAAGAVAMMKSAASDAGSEDKGYRMAQVNIYGRLMWMPVNENGVPDQASLKAYEKDQGHLDINRMQAGHAEEPGEDIHALQIKAFENRIHPFTGEPVSDKYAQMMLTSLKFSQIFMAFQMVRGSMPGRKGPFRLPASDPAVTKIKKNLEAAEAKKTSNIKGTGDVRTVQIIENRYPNEIQQGKSFDYVLKNGQVKIRDGIKEVDFVIDTDGNLNVGRGHSHLANGADVQAAGKLKVDANGNVRRITNESGHYTPTTEQAKKYEQIFNSAGIKTENAWLEIYQLEVTRSGYVDIGKLKKVYSAKLK
ncbi:WXG100 family type VII secretion target [Paenibacillus cucumis Kampfer et al. 2016]|uniref:WXG100 family type VII secretion target n=1 Tax=Paenibacillus cucumis (ex Kampfer et al. 2016) TaxID=1776858 RepID=A0ABS7KK70_9BACL|nr:WXG100 family type VII secretion target [Paenibacillus cucumis (ex Kampfer et al. 2016)]